jgi:hypothetical protein
VLKETDFEVDVCSGAATGALQNEMVFTATDVSNTAASVSATINIESINQPGISIFFTHDASGVPMAGGDFDAAVDFGTVGITGSPTQGVTLTNSTSTSYTVSTPIDVKVEIGGMTSASYTLSAALAAAPATGITYSLKGVTLQVNPTYAPINTAAQYNTVTMYPLSLTILRAPAGSGGPVVGSTISNTIDFTATSN